MEGRKGGRAEGLKGKDCQTSSPHKPYKPHYLITSKCTWSGHFYAIKSTEVLGLAEKGGVTRMGISAYNTKADVERTLEIMEQLKRS